MAIFNQTPIQGEKNKVGGRIFQYDSTTNTWKSNGSALLDLGDTNLTNESSGDSLIYDAALGQWINGGAQTAINPLLSGDVFETTDATTITIVVENYDINAVYTITVSGGTYTFNSGTIIWTLPTTQGLYNIQVQSTYNGGIPSKVSFKKVQKNVTVPSFKVIAYYHSNNLDSTKTDDGSNFLTNTVNQAPQIVNYNYSYGRNGSTTVPESPKLPFTNKIDIYFYNYQLSGCRADNILRYYDSTGTYLGKSIYQKTTNTWSTGNYTNIGFYDASDNLLTPTMVMSQFNGNTYGNGMVHATYDFSDPTKIVILPGTSQLATHEFTTTRTYNVNHPFAAATQVSVEATSLVSTYSGGYGEVIEVTEAGGLYTR